MSSCVRIVHAHTYPEESSRLRPLRHRCTTDGAIGDFSRTHTSDGAIRGLNSSCVVVVVLQIDEVILCL